MNFDVGNEFLHRNIRLKPLRAGGWKNQIPCYSAGALLPDCGFSTFAWMLICHTLLTKTLFLHKLGALMASAVSDSGRTVRPTAQRALLQSVSQHTAQRLSC